MKLLSWNVRGLGQSRTVNRLKHMLQDVNPAVIFLIETKLQCKRMEGVRKLCGYSNGIDVASNGRSGGLSLAWKTNSQVKVRSYSNRYIDVIFEEDIDGFSWRCTGFYGAPEVENREASWDLLHSLDDMLDTPWLVIGDFNELLLASEKRDGRIQSDSQMNSFRTALMDCNLDDIGYRGQWYTWEWGRLSSNNIRERLDRGVANPAWWELFNDYQLDHLVHTFSDHCPILLTTGLNDRLRSRKQHFRFEAAWLLEESCEGEVLKLWNSCSGSIPDRLTLVSSGLELWFNKIKKEKKISVKALQQRLKELNDSQPSDEKLEEILETKLALNMEADREKIYWEQRARANWLKNGDRNTHYFHSFATNRKRKNRIRCLINDSNEEIQYEEGIEKMAMDYFSNLFTTQGVADPSVILEGINFPIT
ncbi:hypothetical protein HRI_003245900 [Hibiscus trionum]|uniref:Endonuclease/exonuclease/phosphatase domain-containing protein n=1 Tax=Hibiscus trionum TaxID=183268 RepID=A0A9W7MCN3_HIBTR|nr:hypothetical protein HRI_003245900 [Hibiscus trionum]